MVVFHYKKPASALPYQTEAVEIEGLEDIKPHLKELLAANEGKEYVEVCVYDSEFNDGTLVEAFSRYLNLSVFRVVILDPLKAYDLSNAYDVHIIINFSKPNALKRVETFKSVMPYARYHLIDDMKYAVLNITAVDFDRLRDK